MSIKLLFLSLLLSSNIGFARPSYEEAKIILKNAPDHIISVMDRAPLIYKYSSKFDGENNVSFTGQVFRQVLINDLKFFMGTLKRGSYPGNKKDLINALNSYFKFNSNAVLRSQGFVNGLSRHHIKIFTLQKKLYKVTEGTIYNSIQFPAKNLVSKIAGNDNPLRNKELKGWNTLNFYGIDLANVDADRQGDIFVEPEDFIQALFQVVARNSVSGVSFTVPNASLEVERIDDANITKDGIHLKEIVHKFLQGAVALSQASGDYLSTDLGSGKGLNADNTTPYKGSKNYTALEHHWDEAFGYFGAARDFFLSQDRYIAKKYSIDSNGDGTISLMKETNLGGVAINTARMDLIADSQGEGELDLSGEAIQAFLVGRELINKKPEGYLKYVEANAAIAIGAWEKTLAAVLIHYLNSTLKMMDSYGTQDYFFSSHAKFWSEMKGYSLAFQFNPTSQLSMANFKNFHKLLGDKPTLMTDTQVSINNYRKNLLKARNILQNAFKFSQINTEAF